MRLKKIKYLLFLFVGCFIPASGQSPLATGDWYKIAIAENGVYKIDEAFLEGYNLSSKNINPQNVRFFISPEKLLPQANNTARNTALTEIPVQLKNTNTTFQDNYILFYAEDPHIAYLDSLGKLSHTQHPYANFNYVFMVIGDSPSKRITKISSDLESAKKVNSLSHFEWYEPEYINLLNSGREWLGEYLVSEWDKSFDIKGRALDQPINIRTQWVSQTYENTELSMFSSGEKIGEMPLRLINYRWNDFYKRYSRAGEISKTSFSFLNPDENFEITFQLPNDIDISSGAYLDYIEIETLRKIAFYDDQHQAYLLEKEPVSINLTPIENFQFVWNVSDLAKPTLIKGSTIENTNELGKLAFFSLDNTLTPANLELMINQDLQSKTTPNLLIIYPEEFQSQAQVLADFRKENDHLEVLLVELNTIYNEFSGGKPDPTAIRDLAKSLWDKNPDKLKYLLLFGDTNFDIKNNNNLDYAKPELLIPTYESKVYLEPIYSYSSDDYFGFLEDHEGTWPEGYSLNSRWYPTQNKDHSIDISVGRLPVKNKIEAKLLVDKLIHYSSSKSNFGAWKRNIAFIADDGDLNIHQRDAEQFSNLAYTENKAIKPNKIYLDAYLQTETELGERAPEANAAFEKAISDGSLIINYNGHGSENGWTDEKLLTINQIQRWNNYDRLPILFTATCEFGRYDNPSVVSGAELALLNPNGGAIALLTTTRPVFSSTNFKINSAFYSTIFKDQANTTRLGDVFRVTKNLSINGEINRNFSLLGDPSMAIAYPSLKINLESINNDNPKDYLIKALTETTLKGSVNDDSFNGSLQISLYDKPITEKTLGGKGNTIMSFDAIKNKLFEGTVEIKNGQFEASFILPVSKDQEVNHGQLYFYAVNSDSTKDAIGGNNSFLIDKVAEIEPKDIDPPVVEISFDEKNQTLSIHTEDKSGIDISSSENLILVLNDTLEIKLNEYYTAIGDFQNGEIKYTFSNLPAGNHTVRLKIADVYNNKLEATFSFTIAAVDFAINLARFSPNPAEDIISLKLEHNAPGANIEFELSFYDLSGRLEGTEYRSCYDCKKELSFGMNIASILPFSGKYLYQVRAFQIASKLKAMKGGQLMFWK